MKISCKKLFFIGNVKKDWEQLLICAKILIINESRKQFFMAKCSVIT